MTTDLSPEVGRAFADAEDEAYRFNNDRHRIEAIAYHLDERAEALGDADHRAAREASRHLFRLDRHLKAAWKPYEGIKGLLNGGSGIHGLEEAVAKAVAALDGVCGVLEGEIAKVRNRLWLAVPDEERADRLASLRRRSEAVRTNPPTATDGNVDRDGLRAAELLGLRENAYLWSADHDIEL